MSNSTITIGDIATVTHHAHHGWVAYCRRCERQLWHSRGRAASVTTARAHNDQVHGIYESEQQFDNRVPHAPNPKRR